MYRSILSLLISLVFLLSDISILLAYEKEIKGLSISMAENIAKAGKKTIAVVDFTDLQGNVTELGRFISEEFSVALAGAGKGFEVVDRTHLESIIAEHKLSATGIIDPQTARKLGQIAGIDAIITGTITPFGDSVRLSIKILDTATAKVIGASSGDIAKTKAIEEPLAKGIEGGPTGPAPGIMPPFSPQEEMDRCCSSGKMANGGGSTKDEYPEFPCPPPQASAKNEIPY
jgi:TolB-like protein